MVNEGVGLQGDPLLLHVNSDLFHCVNWLHFNVGALIKRSRFSRLSIAKVSTPSRLYLWREGEKGWMKRGREEEEGEGRIERENVMRESRMSTVQPSKMLLFSEF